MTDFRKNCTTKQKAYTIRRYSNWIVLPKL